MSRDIFRRVRPGSTDPVDTTGPPLGNVEAPDSYLRIKQNIEGNKAKISEVAAASKNQPITLDQLKQIKKELEAEGLQGGLNLTALPGLTLQSQNSKIPLVTSLPAPSKSSDGDVVDYRNVIWRFNGRTRQWSEISVITLLDVAANLVNYAAAQYAPGVLFYQTDWGVLYLEQTVAGVPTWKYALGIYFGAFSARPATLGTADVNFLFHANDTGVTYRWTGSAWIVVGEVGVILADTHANRVANYAPASYPVGCAFFETDRGAIYRNNGSAWVLMVAWMQAAFASRPADLGANDVNFQFYSTDTDADYYWTGSAWVQIFRVSTLNGLSGAVVLAPGTNITLTPVGNTITIAASGGGGVTSLTDGGSIGLSASTGAVTISVSDPAWPPFTPTVTAAVAVTTAVLDCYILVTGKTAKVSIYWNGTLGVGGSTFVSFSLPVTPKAITFPGFQAPTVTYFNNGVATYLTAGILNAASISTRGFTVPAATTQEIAIYAEFQLA